MSRFLNNLFKRLTSIKNKPRRLYTPQLTYLEDRINPAAFTYNTGDNLLTIDLNTTSEALTLTSSGAEIMFLPRPATSLVLTLPGLQAPPPPP